MTPSVKTKKKNEKLAFEVIALQTVFKGKKIPETVQKKIATAQTILPKLKKRRNKFNTLSCGEKATLFFLKNPTLIPVMLMEAEKRHQQVKQGEDMSSVLLDNPCLYDFCRDQANAIFTQDDTDGANYNYSYKYRQIQSNFAWTMEQAALSAQTALTLFKTISAPKKAATTSTPKTDIPVWQTEAERHADGFYDWRDEHITPAEYDRILEDDHQDQDDIPSTPAGSAERNTEMPQDYVQPNLPGFECFTQPDLPKVRKVAHQGIRTPRLQRTRQKGS